MAGSMVLLASVALWGVLFFPINRRYTSGRLTFAGMLTWYGVAIWVDWIVAWPLALWLLGFEVAAIIEITLEVAGAMAIGLPLVGWVVHSQFKNEMEVKARSGAPGRHDPGADIRWYHVVVGVAIIVALAVWFQWGPNW